jgi:hypothetical protein
MLYPYATTTLNPSKYFVGMCLLETSARINEVVGGPTINWDGNPLPLQDNSDPEGVIFGDP